MVFFAKSFRVHVIRNEQGPVYLEVRNKKIALHFQSNGSIEKIGTEAWSKFIEEKDLSRGVDCYGALGIQAIRGDRYLVVVSECRSVGKITETAEIFCITNVSYVALNPVTVEGVVDEFSKLWKDGTFYFAVEYDLSLTLAKNTIYSTSDALFLWNGFIQRDFILNNVAQDIWLLAVIRGFVKFTTDYEGADIVKVGLVCRKSVDCADLSDRGLSDQGHVANFIEIEQIVMRNEEAVSHLQLRGSPPMYFNQSGSTQLSNLGKVKLTRSFESAIPAFHRFLDQMRDRYGEIYVLNLLDGDNNNEQALLKCCESLLEEYKGKGKSFNYYKIVDKSPNKKAALQQLVNALSENLCESYQGSISSKEHSQRQTSVLYCTCLNISSRTHPTQFSVAFRVLHQQLHCLQLSKASLRVETKITELWTAAGIGLGKMQNVLQQSATCLDKKQKKRVSSFGSIKSVKSFSKSSVSKFSNSTISGILGKDPVGAFTEDGLFQVIKEEVLGKSKEYTSQRSLKVYTTTWVAEQAAFDKLGHTEFLTWLGITPESAVDLLNKDKEKENFDIFVISLLSLPERTKGLTSFQSAIGHRHALVHQLADVDGGACLMIFMAKSLFPHISHVQSKTAKVGGVGANAYGTAIRLNISETSFMFVSCRLSGGAKPSSRNSEMNDLVNAFSFGPFGQYEDHDRVIWMGNLHYKNTAPPDLGIRLVEERNWEKLIDFDELLAQRHMKKAFVNFEEGDVTFPPSFPLNIDGSYDLGEKHNRVPTYNDRILFYGDDLKCMRYDSSNCLPHAHHVAVVAEFTCSVDIIEYSKRKTIENELLAEKKFQVPPYVMSVSQCFLEYLEKKISMNDLSSISTGSFQMGRNIVRSESQKRVLSLGGRTNGGRSVGTLKKMTSENTNRPPRPDPPVSMTLSIASYQLRFIQRCISAVEKYGSHHSGIYRLSGKNRQVAQIANAVEKQKPYGPIGEKYTVDVIAGSLKNYFMQLQTPITTFDLYGTFIEAIAIDDWDEMLTKIRDALEALPKFNYIVLKKVVFHLKNLLQFEESTMMGSTNFAIVFAPSIFRPPDSLDPIKSMQFLPAQTKIMELFIEQAHWLFESDVEADDDMAVPGFIREKEYMVQPTSSAGAMNLLQAARDVQSNALDKALAKEKDGEISTTNNKPATTENSPPHNPDEAGLEVDEISTLKPDKGGIVEEEEVEEEGEEETDIFSNLDLSEDSWAIIFEKTNSPEYSEDHVTISQEIYDSVLLPFQQAAITAAQSSTRIISAVESGEDVTFIKKITEQVVGIREVIACVGKSKNTDQFQDEIGVEITNIKEHMKLLLGFALELGDDPVPKPETLETLRSSSLSIIASLISLHAFITATCLE